jgi:hypothetical protein
MTMSLPKRVIVEYDDGNRKEASFADLSDEGRLELARLGLCPVPPPVAETDHYLLLRWKDGWNEVIGLEKAGTELLRYYCLERVERLGRLSVEVRDDYPMLHIINRLPGEVERILLLGPGEAKIYPMEEKATVKEGGKTERILYDKKRPIFNARPTVDGGAWIKELTEALRVEIKRKGLSAAGILSAPESEKPALYREFAQALGLRATYRQADAYGFVQALVKNISKS